MANIAYKYRLYPTHEQIKILNYIFGTVRFVWNFFLSMRRETYMMWGKSPSYNQCSAELTKLKAEKGYEWLNDSDSTALQSVLKYLNEAYKKFFNGGGYPKFKSKKDHRDSYTTKNSHNRIRFDETGRYIRLPKLGFVRVHMSRPISGRILNATISRTPTGKYYVSVLCEQETPKLDKIVSNKSGGIDAGEKLLAVTDDGFSVDNPAPLEKLLKRLALEQERLSRKTRGSHSYEKQRLIVAKLHERIANIRRDNHQKSTTELMRRYWILGAESLDIKEMLSSSKTSDSARKEADCGWGEMMRELEYKAKWYNRFFIQVDKYYPSSQLCSVCGTKNPALKDLSIREWDCPVCHTHHDRDVNAARNIHKEALRIFGNRLFDYAELNH